MPKIHISGATGFLGRALCKYYLSNGYEVNAMVRTQSRHKLDQLNTFENLHITEIDLNQLENLESSISSGELLIHTAAANHPAATTNLFSMIQANIHYGAILMDAASKTGGRFLNIGTNWQHYKNQKYSPVSLYAASKEALLAFEGYFVEVEGLQAKTLELSDTYGPNDPRDKLIPLLLHSDISDYPLQLTSGKQLIDLVYIDDVVAAIDLINQNWHVDSNSRCMSLTSQKLISIHELVDQCSKVKGHEIQVQWGGKKPLYDRQMHESWAFHPLPPTWKPNVDLITGLSKVFQKIDLNER
jgi:nucleoside-diphosphate-sugar epimerase